MLDFLLVLRETFDDSRLLRGRCSALLTAGLLQDVATRLFRHRLVPLGRASRRLELAFRRRQGTHLHYFVLRDRGALGLPRCDGGHACRRGFWP